jgi:hypothetical protein
MITASCWPAGPAMRSAPPVLSLSAMPWLMPLSIRNKMP